MCYDEELFDVIKHGQAQKVIVITYQLCRYFGSSFKANIIGVDQLRPNQLGRCIHKLVDLVKTWLDFFLKKKYFKTMLI